MLASEYGVSTGLSDYQIPLNPTFFLQLHITPYCNLRCIHCYQEFEAEKEKEILNKEEIFSLIHQYDRFLKIYNQSGIIYLTGGEPTIDPNLLDYVREAQRNKILPMILSNGTLIDKAYATKLKDAGAGIVQISLDGMEKTHDLIRGKGNFKKATAGLDACQEIGLKTLVMFTLHKLNADEMENLAYHCMEHGAYRLAFHRLVPVGRGSQLYDEIFTPKELKSVFKNIKKIKNKFKNKIDISAHDPLWQRYIGIQHPFGCCIGNSGICVMHNGDILPCRRLNKVVGNIRKDSLHSIWNNSYLRQFRKRKNYQGKCSNCKHLKKCTGCRAIAYAATGSEFGEDPQCFAFKRKSGLK